MLLDPSILKCKEELAELNAKKNELEGKKEDVEIIPGSELEALIQQIDALIEGNYAHSVFDYYSVKKPILIRIRTGDAVLWTEAFGDDFDKTTKGQRYSLVGLVEGGGRYRLK